MRGCATAAGNLGKSDFSLTRNYQEKRCEWGVNVNL